MSQNIYDDEAFFTGYSRLSRSVEGLDGAGEWPALRAMLPAMNELRVLDLGCGFGWFARWARTAGAATVLGLDLSDRMLARAVAETADPAITYARADLSALTLPRGCFDLAYASLAFHYIERIAPVFAEIHAALEPGGHFVFSVEHPLYTAPTRPGWVQDKEGRKTWPLDSYLLEGPRTTDWLAQGVVKHHRTIATYLNTLRTTSFTVGHIEEWGPSDADLEAHPDWATERHRPPFLLVAARR